MFRHHNNRLIPVFLLLTVFGGCSSENPEAPSVDAVHALAWIDRHFSGTDKYHATVVNTQGVESCKSCHGEDLNGVGGVPGCDDCHFGPDGSKVPPGSGWTHGTSHQNFAAYQTVCNNCHDTMRRFFDFSPAACHDCHGEGLNHPLGQPWLDKNSVEFHGISALNCIDCHDLGTWCITCHFDETGSKVPAGITWTHGTTPHDTLATYIDVCNQCHTLNRNYGNPPAACHDCHGVALNHPLGQAWLDKNSVEFHGNSTLDCASCHDLNTKCIECHFDENGSKVPTGVTWTHGTIPHDALAAYIAVCNQCHTLNRSYGNGPGACHDCH